MRYIKNFQHVVDIQQKVIYFLLSVIVAFALTYWINSPDLDQAQVYVLFLLFLSVGLWVTEAVPPFAVGLLIFGFLVFALGGYYAEIDPDNASKYVAKYVQTWSNSVIWLMLGGFVMAEAMQKVGLDKTVFKFTISKFGSKPRNVLLGIMLVTAVFSMIMSNTATTAMMIAAVIPFINTLDKNAPLSKALLIGIPAAASLGGMGTIIGSPPNAIAEKGIWRLIRTSGSARRHPPRKKGVSSIFRIDEPSSIELNSLTPERLSISMSIKPALLIPSARK